MAHAPRPIGGRLKWKPLSAQAQVALEGDGARLFTGEAQTFLQHLPPPDSSYAPQQPITRQLQQLINDQHMEPAFQLALDTVRRQGLAELDQLQTLAQFYYFIDALVTWIPQLRIWEWEGDFYHERTDFLRVTQFYYIFNQPELLALQSPIDPIQSANLTPLSRWLRDFAVAWGEFLDTPESAAKLASYQYAPEYAYQDYNGGEGGMGNYTTFNEWFSRTFKDIDRQRPVAQPDNPRIIVFPAESTYVGQWAITTAVGDPMPAEAAIVVKHVEWPIPELLKDSQYARDFEGGLFLHSFLNIFDYHRQHAPATGKILEAKFIPGQVYLEVELERLDAEGMAMEGSSLPNLIIPSRHLAIRDSTGFQFVQCRGLFVLQTAIGKIAVLPMGMAQVSSVVFVKPGTDQLLRLSPEERQHLSYEEQVRTINARVQQEVVGRTVKKGDMISSFLFGGSDIVMVFERQANVHVTASVGVHYPIRSQCAMANIAELLPID